MTRSQGNAVIFWILWFIEIGLPLIQILISCEFRILTLPIWVFLQVKAMSYIHIHLEL